jgi:surfeit locus 1 family protein
VSQPTDYRFLWRPWWIVSHVFVLALVVVFVNLGFWQLRRLDERRTYNALVESRQDRVPVDISELLPAGPAATEGEVDEVSFRSVSLSGTYAPEQEVLIRNRTYDGVPGYWVVTPLVLDDGSAVAVNRGWVPFATTSPDGPWPEFAPPSGRLTVDGMVRESQARSSGLVGGPIDAAEGRLSTLSRVDVARLDRQVPEDLYPLSVDLREQDPAQSGDLPLPVPPPDLSEGPHLNYAGQWFIFATLTAVVYPLLLRRVARNKAAERDAPAEPMSAAEPTAGSAAGAIDLREELGADR